jgi:hypothetical protein
LPRSGPRSANSSRAMSLLTGSGFSHHKCLQPLA